MKWLYTLLTLGACLASFYAGVQVGSDKMGMHHMAFDTMGARLQWQAIEQQEINADQLLEQTRQRSQNLMAETMKVYGQYLAGWSSQVPFNRSLDQFTHQEMQELHRALQQANPGYPESTLAFFQQEKQALAQQPDNEEFMAEILQQEREFLLMLARVRQAEPTTED